MTGGSSKVDIVVFDVESGIYITEYLFVGSDNPLHLHVYEKVVGVDMLLDKAFDLQKGREEVPFVLEVAG